ncbi:MAG TPA: DUF5723 family protein [Bacteroidales bacterium]|nr:DUF5723 family protein [Bacteroidales bacterium]HPT20396.1 DUF5723 family protein [Bacteroidales bacterium]
MKGGTKYFLSLLMVIMITNTYAQNSQVMYFMNLPQNHLANPAFRPSNAVYVGLPVISGINLNVNNNFVNFSDVIMKGQSSDSLITFLHPDYDVDKFLDKIKKKNSIEPEASIQLLGVGFSVGNSGYVFFDINDRINGNLVIPGDLFKLALKGNEQFVGDKIDLTSLRGGMKYYREFGLGYSKDFTNRLRIGIKGKLLFGIAGASIRNRSLGITVNDDYSHTLDADLAVNISAPLEVYMDKDHNIDSVVFDDDRFDTGSGISNFIMGSRNKGLGLDIGATYDLSDKIKVSAAVTDLGYIRWKKDITNLKSKNQFKFSGLDITDVVDDTKTMEEVGDDMLDSLKNAFEVSQSGNPFTTWLPVGIALGGSYKVTNFFSAGLLSYSRIIGRQMRESVTLTGNLNLGSSLSTTLSYTIENHRADNIGAGLAFRAGIVQFYMLADRIPFMWNKIVDDNSTIPLPACWNTINLRLGMNLVFGNKIRKKDDKPMIMVE